MTPREGNADGRDTRRGIRRGRRGTRRRDDGQPGYGPVRGSPLRPSDETIDYFREEEDLRSCTDLGRLERAYRTAVRRMDDYETGRRGDYAGHLWHGAANDAYAIQSRIEESGLFRASGSRSRTTPCSLSWSSPSGAPRWRSKSRPSSASLRMVSGGPKPTAFSTPEGPHTMRPPIPFSNSAD
jgi:hypothetical protein